MSIDSVIEVSLLLVLPSQQNVNSYQTHCR